MEVCQIVAVSDDWAIGKDNKLLWHIPGDLKYFKETTSGYPIVMGRKTYESIGRPLPGRENIVITRQEGYHPEGTTTSASISDALEKANSLNKDKVFIIGGGEIYRQSLDLATRIYLTVVHQTYPEADTFFPPLDQSLWVEGASTKIDSDGKTPAYSLIQLKRNQRNT